MASAMYINTVAKSHTIKVWLHVLCSMSFNVFWNLFGQFLQFALKSRNYTNIKLYEYICRYDWKCYVAFIQRLNKHSINVSIETFFRVSFTFLDAMLLSTLFLFFTPPMKIVSNETMELLMSWVNASHKDWIEHAEFYRKRQVCIPGLWANQLN